VRKCNGDPRKESLRWGDWKEKKESSFLEITRLTYGVTEKEEQRRKVFG